MSRFQHITPACLSLTTVCAARSSSAALQKSGAVKVVVTIPVIGTPSSLKGIKSVGELLSRVGNLAPAEKKRILDAVESGFVTAVRLESSADEQSSWLEFSAVDTVLSAGESRFKIGVPKLEVTKNPEKPNKAPEPTTTSVTSPACAGAAPAVVVAHL